MQNTLLRPIITEKSMADAGSGKYLFAVSRSASKTLIKKIINDTFNVHVTQVATSVVKGKRKRIGQRRQEVTDAIWKKAIIWVRTGEKIGLFESGGEEEKKK